MNNYVDCGSCDIRRKNPSEDFYLHPCEKCKNTGKIPDPKEILCNNCGECMCPLGTMNEQFPDGLHEAKVSGGYDSFHLFDCSTYIFNICEKCLRIMFNNFKIPPEVFSSVGFHDSYEQDRAAYDFRVWSETGGAHQAYLNGMCNAEKDCPNKAIYSLVHSTSFSEDCSCEEHKDHRMYYNTKRVKFIPNKLKPFL